MSSEKDPKQGNTPNISQIAESILQKKTWEDFFYRTPCVKTSYLWGIGCGSVMVAHKLRLYKGNVGHAMNAGILTFIVVSSASFLICANEINTKYDMIKQAFSSQQGKFKEDNKPRKE